MKAYELINKLERYYDKTYTHGQRTEVLRKLQHYTDQQLDAIYEHALDSYRWLPKISELHKAASQTHILKKPLSRGDPSCEDCRGIGWTHVLQSHPYIRSERITAVRRCPCTGLPQPQEPYSTTGL